MSIATKNGSIIVKNGSVAENCGCCASGWYCCADVFSCSTPLSVSVNISATNPIGIYTLAGGQCSAPGSPVTSGTVSHTAVRIRHVEALLGTRLLQLTSSNFPYYVYEAAVTDQLGCPGARIWLSLTLAPWAASFQFFLYCNEYRWQKQVLGLTPPPPRALSEMSCVTIGEARRDCGPQEQYLRVSGDNTPVMSRSDVPLSPPQCIPQSQTIELRQAATVSAPMFEVPAQDGFGFNIAGGERNTTYTGGGDIVALITFSVT